MVTHYKCPNCGDDMAFDSKSGMLSCSSCGRKDSIEGFSEEFVTTTFSEDEAKEYHCKNCGAILITEAETTATTCAFCGAGVVLKDRLSGVMAPVKIVPFFISKEEAMKAFRSWAKNGLLTPRNFMNADRVKGITGMYLPFWLYDLNSKVEVSAKGTKVSTYTSGDYIYTETEYYNVYRDMDINYIKVPIGASKKMNEEIMKKLEPYHNLKDFKSPYLAGYLAEKYSFDNKELFPKAKSRIEEYVESYIRSTVKEYTSVDYTSKEINIKEEQACYTLFPVWMVYYDYNKSEHSFAMNGQTGKVVGSPPISGAKVSIWFCAIAVAVFIVFKLMVFIIGGVLW